MNVNGSRTYRFLMGSLLLLAAALLALPTSAQEMSGTWETRDWNENGGRVHMNMRVEHDGDSWNHGNTIELKELDGLTESVARGTASNVTFRLIRDAGIVTFEGDFRSGRGTGFFRFDPAPSYVTAMAQLGYDDLDDERLYQFAIFDISLDYVRGLRDLGYDGLSEKDLTRFAIHGVRLEYIRGMNQLGYAAIEPQDLVRMRIHGVSVDYVRAVRAALQ